MMKKFDTRYFSRSKNLKQKIISKIKSNKILLTAILLAILSFIIIKMPEKLNAQEILEFNRDLKNYNVKLQIFNQKQVQIAEFMVAVADTEYKRMYGLMKLNSLPEKYGMLFPFHGNKVVSMWMKNTKIPLDMIFLDNKNVIVSIQTNTIPFSLEIVSSEKPAKKALEINAGLVKKYGIKVGQQVKITQ